MRSSFFLATSLVLVAAASAWACCAVEFRGAHVQIADQDVLIIYDAATKTEHFVRRARFTGGVAKGFGFLVPTPEEPKLTEALDGAFDKLYQQIQPEVKWETTTHYAPTLWCCFPFMLASAPRAASVADELQAREAVRVLSTQKVAGYDATVLEADDARALGDWLKAHDYDSRPAVLQWIEPYVAAKWKVTAFKYDAPPVASSGPPRLANDLSTSCVRMSFKTDRPLFPYRVPTDNISPEGQRSTLRVYFLGDKRVAGTLGDGKKPWAGVVKYSNKMEDVTNVVGGVVAEEHLGGTRWLTAFDDPTWPSGTDDLYFAADTDASAVIPPPIIHTSTHHVGIPLDVPFVLVGGFLFVRWRRRRAAAIKASSYLENRSKDPKSP